MSVRERSSKISLSNVGKWLWSHTAGVRVAVLLACVFGLLRVGAALTFVWISKMLVDAAVNPSVDTDRVVALSCWLVGLLIMEMVFSFLSLYVSSKAEIKMKNQMREQLYNRLLICQWGKMNHLHSGDLLNRLIEDVRVVSDTVCKSLPNAIVMAVQFVAAFGLLYFMSWRLAVCVICIMPLFLLISKIYVRRTRKLTADIRHTDSQVQSSMQEGLQHHAVVQTLECETEMGDRLGSLHGTLYGQTMHRLRFGIFSRMMMRVSFITCYATAFLWSVWHLRTGAMTYGMMTAFLQLVARIQNPMSGLAQTVPGFVQALTSIDRLNDVEMLPLETREGGKSLCGPIGLRIEHLSFGYNDEAQKIYSDFTYDFKPGSKTVIMGETGVGKSTLIKLLFSLISPEKGKIKLYNQDVSVEISPDTRCNMVYVPQGNSLLAGTIRSNLLLADQDASEADMREALHTAAADFVYDLPNGLDTPCGELGGGLSEGQAQRIAIARALLRKGGVMMFDEFNSSLDSDTATTMMTRLLERYSQSTIIFISHRQDVSRYCDRVLKL